MTNIIPTTPALNGETTIRELFCQPDLEFRIPAYQRAYSWETKNDKKQVVQFLDDLQEHPSANGVAKPYFFGHFLLERDNANPNSIFIIDGQQRITTLVLFFHCLHKELRRRRDAVEISATEVTDVYLDDIEQVYLMRRSDGKRKLCTVHYDEDLFRSVIRNVWPTPQSITRSGNRLIEADAYMTKRMRNCAIQELLHWADLAGNAVITIFQVGSKEQAAQIFAFQNDRGKDLTNLEKLKAFLVHEVYVQSPESQEREAIEDLERKFADIYRLAEEIKTLSEDQVLGHHLMAFIEGTDNPVVLIKKELKINARDKVEWIRSEFCSQLVESFRHALEIERLSEGSKDHERLIADILYLNAWSSWPILLKLLHFHHDDLPRFTEELRLIEITLFKLQYMKGTSANDLPNLAKRYKGDRDQLKVELSEFSQKGFKWYWNFNDGLRQYLDGSGHFDRSCRYLLWKYENHLREQIAGVHPLLLQEFRNETDGSNLDSSLEHIMPQNPHGIALSDDFRQNYLNCIGNLLLMTRGRNSSLSNKPPLEKASELKMTNYLSHREVSETILKGQRWGEAEIQERKKKLVDFALSHWKVNHASVTP